MSVKVVKDVVDPKTNKSKEITIYDSTRNLAPKNTKPESGWHQDSTSAKADVDFKFKPKAPPTKKKSSDVLFCATDWVSIVGVARRWCVFAGGTDLIGEILAEVGIQI